MQMIPAVVSGQQLCGVARVVHPFVEIDHAIEFTAAADPGVDFLTDFFFLGRVKAVKERIAEDRVLEGWNRCADGSDSFLVSER